jgi:replicative DNA helicase
MSDASPLLPDPHALRAHLSEAIRLIEQEMAHGRSSSSWAGGHGLDLSFVTDRSCGGELRVILGPARAGKTALAATLVSRLIGEDSSQGVAWFSLQESSPRCALRLLSHAACLPLERIMAGAVSTRRDLQQLSEAITGLEKQPVFIDDASPQSVLALRSRFLDWEEVSSQRLILIDPVEALMDHQGNLWGSSSKASKDITNALRRLADELDVLVVCFAGTPAESAAACEPLSLDGLPESFSPLVAEADTVLFLKTRSHDPADHVAAATLHSLKLTDACAPAITQLLFRPDLLRFETIKGIFEPAR